MPLFLYRKIFGLRVVDDNGRGLLLGDYEAFNPDFTKNAERSSPARAHAGQSRAVRAR
jgi:hypothetical protein